MSIPANDAFSLGFVHDSRPRRTRTLSRSPSPKIPFASSRSQPMPHPRKTQRHASGNGTVTRLKDVEEESLSRGRSPEKKKEKVDWEIPRKTLHSSIGFLTLHLYTSDGNPKFVVLALAVALAVLVPLDVLRLRSPTFERLYERCVGFLMRDVEKKTTNGVIWYIIGAIFVLSVYPLDIAVVSILILSWADTAASTIGRLWGRHTPPLPRHLLGLPLAPRKSLAGFLAASLTGGVVAAGFWRWVAPVRAADASWTWEEGVIPAGAHAAWAVRAVEAAREAGVGRVKMAGWAGLAAVGVVAGLVSGVAEALDLGSLDDNMTLPIISGGCIWGFFKVLELLAL